MGTHLGHSALYNLCQIIQTSTSATDIALIRGAVFFIGKELTYLTITAGVPRYAQTVFSSTFEGVLYRYRTVAF